jgi:hypothetical protein
VEVGTANISDTLNLKGKVKALTELIINSAEAKQIPPATPRPELVNTRN